MDLQQTTLDAFIDIMHQFIEACIEVWPECSGMRELKLGFDVAITHAMSAELQETGKKTLINEYHAALKPFYDRCAKRDPTVFTEGEVEVLQKINMREKWLDSTIDDDTRECIWQYVLEMNRFSQMHCGLFNRIPASTLSRIQDTAVNLANKINSGEMKMSDIDLGNIGQQVVSGLDEAEIKEFTNNIMSDTSILQSLCTSMLSGSGGNVEIPNVMSMMSSLGGGEGGNNSQAAAALAALQMVQGMAPGNTSS